MVGAALVALVRPLVAAAGGVMAANDVRAELRARLGWEGADEATLSGALEEALHERGALRPGSDGRIVDVTVIGARLALSHRLSDAEVASSTLDLSPDLGVVAAMADLDGGLHLVDGSQLRRRERRARGAAREGGTLLSVHLEGPRGWLDGYPVGGFVVARADAGFLSLDVVDEDELAPPPDDLVAGLAALYDDANEADGSPVWDEEIQLGAALDRPTWFDRPTLPLGALLEAAGYEVDGRMVGRPGCWEAHARLDEMVGTLVRHEDLERPDTSLLLDLLRAFAEQRDDPERGVPRAKEAQLRRHWPVAVSLVEELRRRGADAEALDRFGRALGGPPGAWLRSRAAAIDGRTAEADGLAGDAMAADPSFAPAVAEAAWYASDRGEARQAVNLLHRVRHHDDDVLVALRRYAALLADTTGRNERCPCGSGRKYKQCHLGRPELPESERVRWLLDKARTYLDNVAPPEVLDDEVLATDDGPAGVLVGMDLLLFDHGWLSRFAAARGPLLPEIERDWLSRWAGGGVASVFRTAAVTSAGGAVLEDLATGDRRTVEPSPALSVALADRLVWCRLLPVGPRWWTSGVVRAVNLAERASMLEALAPGATPEARRAAIVPEPGSLRLQNTSGDPLLFITLRLDAGDASEVTAALDGRLGRDGDEPAWHTTEDTPSMDAAVTATFRLDDASCLVVEVNSLRRRDAAIVLIDEVRPGAAVTAEQRVPMARARAAEAERSLAKAVESILAGRPATDGAGRDGGGEHGEDGEDGEHGEDEVMQEAMAAVRADLDRQWLDHPVPALGGRTPRQAAAGDDDEARADLRTLLVEMEVTRGADVAEYREALGLPRADPVPAR